MNVIDPRTARARSLRLKGGCLIGGFLFGLVMILPLMAGLMGIWPGVMKLTAPIVCPAGFDDTVVARDTYHTRPGETSTTFTMYCLNDRGEVSDEGVLVPMAIITGVLAAAYVALVVALIVIGAVKRRGRGQPDEMPSVITSSTFGPPPWQQPPG